MSSYDDAIGELRSMQESLRAIRDRTCDPKTKENSRYHGLSSAISGINKAIDNMLAEDGSS